MNFIKRFFKELKRVRFASYNVFIKYLIITFIFLIISALFFFLIAFLFTDLWSAIGVGL